MNFQPPDIATQMEDAAKAFARGDDASMDLITHAVRRIRELEQEADFNYTLQGRPREGEGELRAALRALLHTPAVIDALNPSGEPHVGNCSCPFCAGNALLSTQGTKP
jgi:hypothetical protein